MNKRIKKKLAKRYNLFHYRTFKFFVYTQSLQAKLYEIDLQTTDKLYTEALEKFKTIYKAYVPCTNLSNLVCENGIVKGILHVDLAKNPDVTHEFPLNICESDNYK